MPLHPMQPRQKTTARQIRGSNYRQSMADNKNTSNPENYKFDRFEQQGFDWPIQNGWPIRPDHAQSSVLNGIPLPHYHDGNSAYKCWNTIPGSQTNFKIDIHCGNQTNPINVNSPNASNHVAYHDTGAVGGQTIMKQNCCEGDLSSLKLPYVGLTFVQEQVFPMNLDCDSMEDYDTADVPTSRLSSVKNNNFRELMQMAMRGCELAEEMAITHQNRPCFKKIDSLCARMKQDLMRPDSVLANINSQGIVWAVKDMIFVFTRIVNAWNIIKGYVYNTPEGLNNVKSALSSDFYNSFTKWEESTLDFCNNLIESFENINEMVQSQRVAMQKLNNNVSSKSTGRHRSGNNSSANSHVRSSKNALDEAIKLMSAHSVREKDTETYASQHSEEQPPVSRTNYFLNVVKNSEETQRQAVAKGTYMKTGLYNPLKKEIYEELPTGLAVAPPNPCVAKPPSELKSIFTQTSAPICFNPLSDTCDAFDNGWLPKRDHGDPFVAPDASLVDVGVEKEMFNKHVHPPPVARPLSINAADPKIEYLLHRLCNLKEAEYFFSSQFTKNYFPDFQTSVPNYSDLRTIILKVQAGGYSSFADIVHDLRHIVYCAKHYLQIHPNALLRSSTAAFEKELEIILHFISAFDSSHILGSPKDAFDNIF